MKKTILAVLGSALLVLGAMSAMGYGPVAAQPSYSQQTGQQNMSQSGGNNTGNDTAQQTNLAATGQADANATKQLHAFLDSAIIAAKNNDTHGMMISLSQVLEGLGNLSNPVTETAGTNDTMTSGQSAGNQTGNTTGNSGSTATDANRTAGPEEIPSDFPDR